MAEVAVGSSRARTSGMQGQKHEPKAFSKCLRKSLRYESEKRTSCAQRQKAKRMKPYYDHAGITIYQGDCREIVPQLGRFDLLLTDPPYGIGFGSKHTKWSANRGTILGNWDSEIPDVKWLLDSADVSCVWGGERFGLPVSRCWLAWVKPDAPPTFTAFELAWTSLDRPARWIQHSISATNAERVGHPTQKPLRVMSWSIQQVAPESKTILDPFMGSGTTLRAAKNLNRRAIGIEIEERYCEIAAQRMAQEVLAL